MAIDSIKCIYRIFLASPGDLVPERRFAEEVVIDVNTYMASRQWYVELHKWENLSPGFGRAQALINRHIERCDLFVGLLWERWGQPTGQYTSGFHEEYEVALSRRQRSGKPEIWMAFKTPRRGKLDDPGPELAKVLAFQRTQQQNILYKQFKTPKEWRRHFHNWLVDHLLRLPPCKEFSQDSSQSMSEGRTISDASPYTIFGESDANQLLHRVYGFKINRHHGATARSRVTWNWLFNEKILVANVAGWRTRYFNPEAVAYNLGLDIDEFGQAIGGRYSRSCLLLSLYISQLNRHLELKATWTRAILIEHQREFLNAMGTSFGSTCRSLLAKRIGEIKRIAEFPDTRELGTELLNLLERATY